METPSSTRRVTRSQTLASVNGCSGNIPLSKKLEDSDNCGSKSRQRTAKQQQDRSALIDITNDSPIVGLAMQTPSSAMAKKKNSRIKSTPGSGEALLRGQVKTLLQKVEEEAELTKISMETRPFINLVNSPMALLAPTPANTPQIPNPSDDGNFGSNGLDIVIASPVVEEHLRIPQVVSEEKEESLESQKSLSITRSLLLDFSDKSESWESSDCSSVVTHRGESESKERSPLSPDEDDSSVWSMQVNASTRDEENEDDQVEVHSYIEEEEDGDEELLDGLCEGMRKMSVREKTMAEFAGKHTRFIYDSDDEEIVEKKEQQQSPGVLRLKGLPTPKGKHSRFAAEDEEGTTVSPKSNAAIN